MKAKKLYYFFLHMLFITGIMYAFAQFITTPRAYMLERRLWAYENWIIISFYSLFVFLTLTERELRLSKIKKPHIHLREFKRILTVLVLLLIFPWGVFLLFAPNPLLDLLKLNAMYWRMLGIFSLLGALVFSIPLFSYRHRLSLIVFILGAVDNFAAGIVLTTLFILRKISLLPWSAAPLLLYFGYFFWEQVVKYRHLIKNGRK